MRATHILNHTILIHFARTYQKNNEKYQQKKTKKYNKNKENVKKNTQKVTSKKPEATECLELSTNQVNLLVIINLVFLVNYVSHFFFPS